MHPTATGHAAIANLLIDSGYFPTVTNIPGDIDGDGKVDVPDAVAVLTEYARVAAGNEGQFSDAQKGKADVNKDGVIDVRGLGTQIGPEVIIPGQSALIMYK